MKQFHTSVGNMLIYLNVQIIFDDIRNKLFPGGETIGIRKRTIVGE